MSLQVSEQIQKSPATLCAVDSLQMLYQESHLHETLTSLMKGATSHQHGLDLIEQLMVLLKK